MTDDIRKGTAFYLEKLALGELDEQGRTSLDARLSAEEQQQALKQLAGASDEHLRANPPAWVAAQVLRKARGGRVPTPGRQRASLIAAGLVAAAAAAFVVLRLPVPASPEPAASGEQGETLKGLAPSLKIYRKTATGFAPIASGGIARGGDLLQLRYQAAEATHGAIFSIDGGGAVTLHFPTQASGDTTLKHGVERTLDHSYELDQAPAFERFFFVTAVGPLDVPALLASARTLAASPQTASTQPLALPQGRARMAITEVYVRKQP